MNATYSQASNLRSLVLVADGFEEQATISCVHALREQGKSAVLVGLTAGPVTGSRGIVLHPDLSLDQVAVDDPALLTVIPGGRRCAAFLLADPRVHRLLARTSAIGGRVALLQTAANDAEALLRVPSSRQGTLSVRAFVTRLLDDLV